MTSMPRHSPHECPAMSHLWSTLTAAPHRITFLPGALLAPLTLLWWLFDLGLRYTGHPGLADASLPAPLLHGWMMIYGLFPFFIFGFLFTAAPNWLNATKIPRAAYITTALCMGLGVVMLYATAWSPKLGLVGGLLHLAGWGTGTVALWYSVARAAPQDKRHAWITLVSLGFGWMGDALFFLWQAQGTAAFVSGSNALGLWACLTPLFLTVCHRMIPWFTSRIVPAYVLIRPFGLLWLMLAACLAHAGLQASGLSALTWLVDLPLAGMTFWFSSVWGLRPSWSTRLLAMLHIAFLWAGLAFALHGLESAAQALGFNGSLGMTPLHALGIGFFSTMLIAMASRVTLGHSGKALVADEATWKLFWLIQATALTRMAPDILPVPPYLVFVAGGLWLLTFSAWAWKYAPLYWCPRADGKPG